MPENGHQHIAPAKPISTYLIRATKLHFTLARLLGYTLGIVTLFYPKNVCLLCNRVALCAICTGLANFVAKLLALCMGGGVLCCLCTQNHLNSSAHVKRTRFAGRWCHHVSGHFVNNN